MKWPNPIELRHRKIADFAMGKVLDVGYADHPNPYLSGVVIGLDLIYKKTPANYSDVKKGNALLLDKYFRPNTFDTIIASEVIEHLEHPAGFLRAAHKVLRNKGVLLLSTPNPYYPPTLLANFLFLRPEKTAHNTHDPYHINLFTYRNMITLLEHCDFRLTQVMGLSGLVINFTYGPVFPLPRPFCQNYLYIARKKSSV